MNGTIDELFWRSNVALLALEGWCTPDKAHDLIRAVAQVRPKLCVEIGVFGGSSLIPIALAAKAFGGKVIGVDPWSAEAALDGMVDAENRAWWADQARLEQVYDGCVAALDLHKLRDVCELWRMTSAEAVGVFADESVGLFHLDGNHSEASATRDIELWLPKIDPAGVIFFDDVNWHEGGKPTTRPAIRLLALAGWEIVASTGLAPGASQGNCAVLRR